MIIFLSAICIFDGILAFCCSIYHPELASVTLPLSFLYLPLLWGRGCKVRGAFFFYVFILALSPFYGVGGAFYSIVFIGITKLRNPSYAKALAGKTRKTNYKRQNVGAVNKKFKPFANSPSECFLSDKFLRGNIVSILLMKFQ